MEHSEKLLNEIAGRLRSGEATSDAVAIIATLSNGPDFALTLTAIKPAMDTTVRLIATIMALSNFASALIDTNIESLKKNADLLGVDVDLPTYTDVLQSIALRAGQDKPAS